MTPGTEVRRGIPTATNVDHVALTVPELDEAVRFFVDVIGADLILEDGPFEDPGGDWMYEQLRMPKRAALRAALLRLGPTLTLELYGVSSPEQSRHQPQPADVGAAHLSIRVGDFDRAFRYLCEQDVIIHGIPQEHSEGALSGCRWVHFETPWGLVLEIVHWPEQLPYEQQTPFRLAPAAAAWQSGADQGQVSALVASYYRLVNAGGFDQAVTLFEPDAVFRAAGSRPRHGLTEIREFLGSAFGPYREHRDQVTNLLVDGDSATAEVHFDGELANGRPISFDAVTLFHASGGLIRQVTNWYDTQGVRRLLAEAQDENAR